MQRALQTIFLGSLKTAEFMDPHSLLRCPAVRANEAKQNKATNHFPKVASRFSAQKVSLDLYKLMLLGWDLEALLSKGGILLLLPVLRWDLDLGGIKLYH